MPAPDERPAGGAAAPRRPRAGRWAASATACPPNTGGFGVVELLGLLLARRPRSRSTSTRSTRARRRRSPTRSVARRAAAVARRGAPGGRGREPGAASPSDLGGARRRGAGRARGRAHRRTARLAPRCTSTPSGGRAGGRRAAAGGRAEWGLDPQRCSWRSPGRRTASSSAERLLDRIAAGLRRRGRRTSRPTSTQVRAVGGDAAAALDELLVDYGWRVVQRSTSLEPTLAERPDAVLAAIRAALAGWSARRRPDGAALAALRAQVPEADRARFDEPRRRGAGRLRLQRRQQRRALLAAARLVRRAVLEVGRRLVERGAAAAADDALEATSGRAGRAARRRRAVRGASSPSGPRFRRGDGRGPPPPMLGRRRSSPRAGAGPEHAAARGAARRVPERGLGSARRRARPGAATVGTEVVRGRAVVVVDPLDALGGWSRATCSSR